MIEVIGVTFKQNGRIYYFDPGKLKINKHVTVIVETEHGQQFGTVVTEKIKISKTTLNSEIKKIVRISTKSDYLKHKKNQKDNYYALKKCREIASKTNPEITIISANYTFDRDKIIFKFISENRVDFRKLARDLASVYKVRIELRQIGVRDKAKEIGGIGPCGQKLCCARFLNNLNTVSINMAKNQNIALNPTKINGVCGRLMCCLEYEDECYSKCRKKMKVIGEKVQTPYGEGTITSLDILRQKYKVNVENYGTVEIDKNASN